MPCVFPILALKALHLAKSGGDERAARRDAIGYAAGAIIGTGALGAALLIIRAAGTEIGWAFQLQDPRTILVLSLLTTAITLNLLRVFEVPAVTLEAFPSDSFGTGALAAFVATPCAGPFLGAALGTALLLPPAGSVAVFAALGLGSRPAVRCGRLHSSASPPPAEARSLDGAPAAIPRHPDGADGARLPMAAVAARRRDGVADRPRRHRGRHTAARQRGHLPAQGASDRLCGDISCRPGCGSWRLVHAGTAGCRLKSRRWRGGVDRGARSRSNCSGASRCSSISPPIGA